MFMAVFKIFINGFSAGGRKSKIKRLLLGIILTLTAVLPLTARAEVNVNIGVPLPPPVILPLPPPLIPIPETNVYVAPDAREDIFFHRGWWWRPWNGHWYRSRHYNSGWAPYQSAPAFYSQVPPTWRHDYGRHNWKGHSWNYQHVSHKQVEKNWRKWEKNRHWERHNYWGVQDMRHQPYQRVNHAQNFGPQHHGHEFRNGHGPGHGHGHGHGHH